jgi:hypothetical protein
MLALSCTTPFDTDVQSLGRFQGCLRRLSDGCTTVEGRCLSRGGSDLGVTLGRRDDGTFLWAPDVDGKPLEGRIAGRRFEIVASLDGVDLPCGCRGDVIEVIRGELLVDSVPPECAPGTADGGCGDVTRPTAYFGDIVPDEGWVVADVNEAEELANVTGFRAWVVDTATASSEGGCSCAACGTTFEAVGRL